MDKLVSISPELVPREGHHYGRLPPNPNLTHEETPEFVAHWRAIMLRKWSILALAVLGAVIANLAVSQMDPVYRSSATVLIEINPQKLVPIGDAPNAAASYYKEYFQTQAEVLKSREVAQRVITKLKLTKHPDFDPRQKKPSALMKGMNAYFPGLAALFRDPARVDDQASLETEVLKGFADGLSIEPVRLSQLVKVSFEAHDATLAAAAANATAEAYIQADLEHVTK